jgi:membrane-associated protease RseP (regulator of RpoE activity)
MTALSAMAALVGAGGIYAATPTDGQERRVVIEKDGDGPGRVIVRDGQDVEPRVIVRKMRGADDGPGFDIFGMGGSRVGMVVRDVETADVAKEKLAGVAGAIVTEVGKEGAAQKAGIKTGDVVTSFDGERVRSARQLERLVEETPAGRTVKVAVQRAGAAVTLDVTPETPKVAQFAPGMRAMPGQGPDVFRWQKRVPSPEHEFEGPQGAPFRFEMPTGRFDFDAEPFAAANRGRLGVRVQDLSEDLAGYFGVKQGVLVAGVEADAPAGKAGVKAGDVITAVNGQAITDPSELRREVAKVEDGKTAELAVTRDKKALTLKVEVTARDRTIERKMRRSL